MKEHLSADECLGSIPENHFNEPISSVDEAVEDLKRLINELAAEGIHISMAAGDQRMLKQSRLRGKVEQVPARLFSITGPGSMECTLITKASDGIEDEVFLGDELRPFLGREVEITIRIIA